MVSFPHPPHPPQPEPELPPTHPNNSNGSGGSLPRAQSNLDILSQTAAVVIEESISSSSAHSSPYAAVRVFSPPAEDKNNNTSRLLALPEIVAANATSHPQQPQQPHRLVFLQQKRGFLPPALPYERSASSMLVGSEVVIDNNNGCIEIPCDYSTAGIFMSHSNSSFNSNSNSAAIRASMSSPAEDQLQQHHHPSGFPTSDMSSSHRSVATTPTGGAGNHLAAANNNDAAVQSFLLANVNSFSSHSSSGGGHTNGMGRPLFLTDPQQQQPLSMPTAFVPPRPALHHLHYRPTGGAMVETTTVPLHASTASADDGQILVRENLQLRLQLSTRDMTIEMLQAQVDSLQQEIRQLRQLPTGKISQIPLEDMLSIMREYGSEISETAMPPRKSFVQKASVVRQFRRWNPTFLEWFEHVEGKWVPKLGKTGEIQRRHEARREATSSQRKKKESAAGSSENETFDDNDAGDDESFSATTAQPSRSTSPRE